MLLRSIFAGLLASAQVPEPPPPAAASAIQWRAPRSCPDRAALVRGIQSRLGRSLSAGELDVEGVVTVHPTPPLYRLTLRLDAGGRGERRTLSAETCASLVDATAVLAVLAVEARPRAPARLPVDVTVDEPTPESEPESEPGATPEPTSDAVVDEPVSAAPGTTDPPEEVAPEAASEPPIREPPAVAPEPEVVEPPPPPPRRAPGGFVRVHAGPELGALPKISGAVGLAGGLLWRQARLELSGLFLAPRTGETPRGDLRVWLAAGGVTGCARLGRGLLEVPLCGGLELGAMRGDAREVPGGRSATSWWLAAVAGAGAVVRPGPRWGVWAALQMVVGLAKPGFQARDPGPVLTLHQPAAVAGRLLLGVELRFADPR